MKVLWLIITNKIVEVPKEVIQISKTAHNSTKSIDQKYFLKLVIVQNQTVFINEEIEYATCFHKHTYSWNQFIYTK